MALVTAVEPIAETICEPVAAVNALVPLPYTTPEIVVTPVPPLATGKVPVTPVVKGKPVALVRTAADGVPRLGVRNVGEAM